MNTDMHHLLTMKLRSMHLVQQARGMSPTRQPFRWLQSKHKIQAWFRAHQDRVAQLDDGFIRWLSRLLDQNQITPAEMGPLRMLTYRYQDYAQHGSVDTREEVFYVLPLTHFRKTAQIPQSEPPAPRRAFPGHPTIEHVFHLFMLLQLEAWRAFLIQERFHPAFCMTQTACHFLH